MAPSEPPQDRLRGRSPRSKSRESDAPLRARLHPRLRPRQTRARPLTVAAHLRPRPAGGEASVQLDLRRARGEERAEDRSEEHTSELQSPCNLVCRLLLEKKKNQ